MKIEGLATRFDMFDKFYEDLDKDLKAKYDGLVIDKSTSSQTICQTTKYYQTRVGVYIKHMLYSHREYMGYRGLSIYRRIPPISYSETLSVSNIGMGDMAGYTKRYQIYLLAYIRIWGYRGYMV